MLYDRIEYVNSFSVVIASIGRLSLNEILVDISKTPFETPIEIILVLDGVWPGNPNIKIWRELCSKVIMTDHRVGPSLAYTLGLKEVTTDYFRIFSDDDVWDKDAFVRVSKCIRGASVLVCNSKVQDEFGLKERQSNFPITSSPLKSVYAPILPWKRNKIYFHLTSMIFPNSASKIFFDPSLRIREDLDWLEKIFQAEIPFEFSDEIIGTVNPSHSRSQSRQTLQADIEWVNRLKLISDDLGRSFVYFHCFRSFSVTGNLTEIVKRIIPLSRVAGFPRFYEFFALIFYLFFGFYRKIKIRLT